MWQCRSDRHSVGHTVHFGDIFYFRKKVSYYFATLTWHTDVRLVDRTDETRNLVPKLWQMSSRWHFIIGNILVSFAARDLPYFISWLLSAHSSQLITATFSTFCHLPSFVRTGHYCFKVLGYLSVTFVFYVLLLKCCKMFIMDSIVVCIKYHSVLHFYSIISWLLPSCVS